ncbi:ABC transporter substrate-binding protein [uncultured Albimonas sp.]|uniref:ABC transporter substrate-binding protein n=1 Tax=uncultured Albimonas sp. TaxID=1331701 RepID=UPI0030EEDB6C|tara:strand:+ start:973 stop:2544 length:1572 start_codon:yes stop_codon:yes gene_type:complete
MTRIGTTPPGWRPGRRQVLAGLAGTAGLAAMGLPGAALSQDGGTLRVISGHNPSSLDPSTGASGTDHTFLYCFYDSLVDWDPETLAARPGLASSWEFPEANTLVLTLEQGVTFHDGAPFDAAAVKFNLDRNRGAQVSNVRNDLANIEEVEATDAHTVTIRLKAPDTALPLILSDRAGLMVSPKALGDDPERDMARNPVGTGPWRFVSWTDSESVRGERFADHWREGVPGVDGLELRIITEKATAFRAIQSGQADLAYLLAEQQKTLIERMPQLQLFEGPTLRVHKLYFNSSRGPLADVRVRQAIGYALDREAFVTATQAGVGEPARMVLPKAHWAWSEAAAGHMVYDPDKAKALLKEAGFEDGVELTIMGMHDQASVQRSEVVLEQLAAVGVTGRFVNGPVADVTNRFMGPERFGDAFLSYWTGRPDPTLTYALLYTESSFYNAGRVAPPEGFLEALQASRESQEIEARAAALGEVQRIAMEAALSVPIAVAYEVDAATTAVSGYQPNLLGKPKFRTVTLGSS